MTYSLVTCFLLSSRNSIHTLIVNSEGDSIKTENSLEERVHLKLLSLTQFTCYFSLQYSSFKFIWLICILFLMLRRQLHFIFLSSVVNVYLRHVNNGAIPFHYLIFHTSPLFSLPVGFQCKQTLLSEPLSGHFIYFLQSVVIYTIQKKTPHSCYYH